MVYCDRGVLHTAVRDDEKNESTPPPGTLKNTEVLGAQFASNVAKTPLEELKRGLQGFVRATLSIMRTLGGVAAAVAAAAAAHAATRTHRPKTLSFCTYTKDGAETLH